MGEWSPDAARHHDACVPNQFFTGYIQGGLNASVTEQVSRQGYHITYIVSETLRRGFTVAEPSQQAQDAYVKYFGQLEVDTSGFQRECTPSYFTNEGQVKAPWALFRAYGPGRDAFQKLLHDWRSNSEMQGWSWRSDAVMPRTTAGHSAGR